MTKSARKLHVLAVLVDVKLTMENSAVFQAQVGEQLIALAAMGLTAGLVCISANPRRFHRAIGERLERAGVVVDLVDDSHSFLRNLWAVARRVRARRSRAERAYVRGLWGPVVLLLSNPLNRLPHVYDVRGDLADEMRAVGTPFYKRWLYKGIESWAIRRAAAVTAVTRDLANQLSARHSIGALHIIPSSVDTSFFGVSSSDAASVRVSLGYSEHDIVLVYSGGLSHYQQVPAMLEIWRRLLVENDVKFLLLTNDNPHSKELEIGDLSAFGERLQHRSVPRESIPAFLGASNIGFMLRDSRQLNRTASPVKFAEYTAAGLSIVASPGTGDISDLVASMQLGVLVDPHSPDAGEVAVRQLITSVRLDPRGIRERSVGVAKSKYDWRAYEPVYRLIYGTPDSAVTEEFGTTGDAIAERSHVRHRG